MRWIAACACVIALAAGCTRADKDGDAARPRAGATTTAPGSRPEIHVAIEAVDNNGTKSPGDDIVGQVRSTLDAYIAQAIVAPLHSGKPAGDLSAVFTPEALASLNDPAIRATLVEEGLPPASRSITATSAKASLSSIAGPDEVVAVIGARLDLALHARGPKLDVKIVRQGELVLSFVAEANAWRIDSFALRTQRDSP